MMPAINLQKRTEKNAFLDVISDRHLLSVGRRVSDFCYRSVTAIMAGTISIFSPHRGASYRLGRNSYRSYTAGSLRGPNQKWLPRNTSGDAEIKRDHKLIMARCRDLARNNPYIRGVIVKICNNVIRNGIRPQAKVRGYDGSIDDLMNRDLERIYKKWSRKKHVDVTGHDSLASIQKIVLRHVWTDGEILIHRVWDRTNLKKALVPFRIELLECDMLADYIDGDLGNGIVARRGIGFDQKTGRPVKYFILPYHPGDYQCLSSRANVIEIPASDIIHVFEKERASQTRGVSWFASIIMDAFDLTDYQNYEMVGAKCAAAFGIFIKTQYPELMSSKYEEGTIPSYNIPKYIQPGIIQTLPVGTNMEFASHNRPGVTYEPFVKTSLKSLSAGVTTSYSAFSNDYSDSSYSSDRAAKLEERLSYQGQQGFIIEKLLEGLWEWFCQGVYIGGVRDLPGFATDPDSYTEAVEHQAPGWAWVDPQKESKAAATDLATGITTRKKLLAQRGEDFDETLEQLMYEEKALSEYYKLKAENIKIQEMQSDSGGQNANTTQ